MRCHLQENNDSKNSGMELQLVKPHTQDQSSNNLNEQRLLSHHSVRIKHNITIFQICEYCLPNQFHHPNKRPLTIPGSTHGSPKVRKTNTARTQHYNLTKDAPRSPHYNDTYNSTHS